MNRFMCSRCLETIDVPGCTPPNLWIEIGGVLCCTSCRIKHLEQKVEDLKMIILKEIAGKTFQRLSAEKKESLVRKLELED